MGAQISIMKHRFIFKIVRFYSFVNEIIPWFCVGMQQNHVVT